MAKFELDTIRHSAAHVMAAAVDNLYPDVRFDIGPSTAEGFYYDFDLPQRLGEEDLEKIEQEVKRIIAADLPFERESMGREAARAMLAAKGQNFKLERLDDIPEGEEITFYRCGDFVDLCRGPHVETTGQIKAVKLLSVAGSYYRGHEDNPMLQRLYGTAFQDGKALKKYLKAIEEAKKRDHRRLGKELDLFSTSDSVGPGLVSWHPKGARVRYLIEKFWQEQHYNNGYELLYTPHIGRANLWETSGHLSFYREAMYAPIDVDGNEYYVKPMNCPFHIEVYKTRNRSYRELPLRWAELGTVYRYEKGGVLHGLLRVRGFTQDDAHIICTPEQIGDEICEVLRFCLHMWKSFGFQDVQAYLSTRPAKAVGEASRWEQALESLEQAVRTVGLQCEVDEGGGAFYGPKIDLKIRDAIGREWQTSTIQFDFNLPERFDMTYIGSDGAKHRPYMVHRALLGSLERFFGVFVEHCAGAFPVWLAPEQVRVLPIGEAFLEYAETLVARCRAAGLRVSVDAEADTIGAKIRRGRNDRIPYLAVVGEREAEAGQAAVRGRSEGQMGPMDVDVFLAHVAEVVAAKR